MLEPEPIAKELASLLAAPADESSPLPSLSVGPLPGNLWARRLLVALDDHVPRQLWVARVVATHLRGDLGLLASDGAFGHPQHLDQQGRVPGLPDWSYFFHGIGCCLTHDDGTTIDVDFDRRGADGIDPYFYGRYLESLPAATGLESLLRWPEPVDQWWMAELDQLDGLGWVERDRCLRILPLGKRWAQTLRPAFGVMLGADDPTQQLRAAVLLEDFAYARRLRDVPPGVVRQAEESVARHSTELGLRVQRKRSRHALCALSVIAPNYAQELAEKVIGDGPIDGLVSLALELCEEPGISAPALMSLAVRAQGREPPNPHVRTVAITQLMRRYRAHSMPDDIRAGILHLLRNDGHSEEGLVGLLLSMLEPSEGIARLERALRHDVPCARSQAACALVLLNTPETVAALHANSDRAEAAAALSLLRGFEPEPGPEPRGEIIDWRGTPRRVYRMDEILAANEPAYVSAELAQMAGRYGPLIARWWVH